MKASLLLVVFLLLARLAQAGPVTPLNLLTAQSQQKVKVEARALGLGPDKLRCVLTNLTGQELKLRVPPGLHFAADDAGAQDIFTFEQKLLVLAPGASKEVPLWAFCMEQHDYSPRENGGYALQGLAGKGLQPLGDSLQKYPGLAEYYGQMFVWSLSDGGSLREVSVDSKLLRGAKNVLAYIGKVTGRAVPRARASNDNRPSVKTFSKRATLLYHSPTAQVATLKVYDTDGSEMYELLKDRRLTPGVVHYTVGLNSIVDIDETPVYTIRLLSPSGQVLKEVKVDANTSEQVTEPEKVVFNFPFEVKNLTRNARIRVRLTDGTLVEEILERKYLPPGSFRMQLFFNHLYPSGTAFVAQLETADGKVLSKQPVVKVEEAPVPAPAAPAPAAPARRRR
ncbi:hypothetical protein [Hymenobacter saemangeumensis]